MSAVAILAVSKGAQVIETLKNREFVYDGTLCIL